MIKGNEIHIPMGTLTYADCKFILDRVARMVSTAQDAAFPQEEGYEFNLDYVGDNWWGKIDMEAKEIVIMYRYGNEYEISDTLASLEAVIRWLFYSEGLNDQALPTRSR